MYYWTPSEEPPLGEIPLYPLFKRRTERDLDLPSLVIFSGVNKRQDGRREIQPTSIVIHKKKEVLTDCLAPALKKAAS